jgi:hypothetical protein
MSQRLRSHVRIFLVPPGGFGRFCIATFGASLPSPSMSRTSRPDVIASLQCMGPAMGEGNSRALVVILQGCREK